MTPDEIRAIGAELGLPNVSVKRLTRGMEPTWLIAWGRGLEKQAITVPVAGATADSVRAALEAATQ